MIPTHFTLVFNESYRPVGMKFNSFYINRKNNLQELVNWVNNFPDQIKIHKYESVYSPETLDTLYYVKYEIRDEKLASIFLLKWG